MPVPDTFLISADTLKKVVDTVLIKADTLSSAIDSSSVSFRLTALGNKIIANPFWIIVMALAGIAISPLLWYIDKKRERKKFLSVYVGAKWYRAKEIKYELFSGARIKQKSVYATREIETEILKHIADNKNIVLLGTPLRGKTRTMVECLRKLKSTEYLIALPSEFSGEISFPRKRWFCKKRILVLDDLQNFFASPNNATRLIEVALQNGFSIVANCRSTFEWKTVQNAYDTISKRFDVIEIPTPNNAETDAVIKANKLNGIPAFYDRKNIGTLIIDLDTLRQRYSNTTIEQGKILLCLKELYVTGVFINQLELTINSIKELAEHAHDLKMSDDNWNKEIQWTIDNDFAIEGKHGLLPEPVYLEQIVAPHYTLLEIIENALKAFKPAQLNFGRMINNAAYIEQAKSVLHFMKLKAIARTVSEYNQLIARMSSYAEAYKVYEELKTDEILPDKQTFYTLINLHVDEGEVMNDGKVALFNDACKEFGKVHKAAPGDVDLLIYWGIALADMARADNNNPGLFNEACAKYKQATDCKPDDHQAWYNWGVILDDMARVDNNNPGLFNEACAKYKQATDCKPDDHQAWYNWGIILTAMARADNNNPGLFNEACAKYKQATDYKPDYPNAWYNWGITLAAIARADNNPILLKEAMEKKIKAHHLRPDLIDEQGNRIG